MVTNGSPGDVAEYLYNDPLGTLRATSPSGFTGGLGAQRAYTAFGEVVAGPTDRFGYVGAHGYQAHDGVPFLHVGARYYDPGSGRFLQRDPIGIAGGPNVYSYVKSEVTIFADPNGLQRIPVKGIDVPLDYKGVLRIPRPPVIPPPWWNPPARFTPPQVAACVVVAVVTYKVGRYVAEETGISDGIGNWLFNLCPSCWY